MSGAINLLMHLIIDGYNLLHAGRFFVPLTPDALQRSRDRLLDQLLSYRKTRYCDITVVFDGWQGGWATEKKERRKGIELIFSRLGEKADEVIKRLVRDKGSGAVVVTSDREVARYAERRDVAVIPSDRFRERIESSSLGVEKKGSFDEEERREFKKKGPSRMLSKKEKKLRAALKKL
jgi:predicted RNA-binding protein with PIN domain